jgi:L-threonylcarbamoyladenylate synthase
MLKRHYSPGIPIFLNKENVNNTNALITFGKKFKNKKNCFNLSKKSNLKEAASNLYKTLRKIKKLNFKKIYIVKIPNLGPGIAINDRLKRAAKK